jgi:agmatine/peptidylarginine deiminase
VLFYFNLILKPSKIYIMLYNMTPHAITLLDEDYNVSKVIEPSGRTIRLKQDTRKAGFSVDDIPITKTEYQVDFLISEESIGLPAYELGTFYIVSQLVKNALPEREDLLVPAQMVRMADGTIVGCRSLGI